MIFTSECRRDRTLSCSRRSTSAGAAAAPNASSSSTGPRLRSASLLPSPRRSPSRRSSSCCASTSSISAADVGPLRADVTRRLTELLDPRREQPLVGVAAQLREQWTDRPQQPVGGLGVGFEREEVHEAAQTLDRRPCRGDRGSRRRQRRFRIAIDGQIECGKVTEFLRPGGVHRDAAGIGARGGHRASAAFISRGLVVLRSPLEQRLNLFPALGWQIEAIERHQHQFPAGHFVVEGGQRFGELVVVQMTQHRSVDAPFDQRRKDRLAQQAIPASGRQDREPCRRGARTASCSAPVRPSGRAPRPRQTDPTARRRARQRASGRPAIPASRRASADRGRAGPARSA